MWPRRSDPLCRWPEAGSATAATGRRWLSSPSSPTLLVTESGFEAMSATRRITISLPEETLRAADATALRQGRSRAALVEDALRWYLRVQDLAWDEASPEELEGIERGRAEIARGEFVSFEEIKRDLEADLLEQRTKESDKASAE
jgi:predicted transcriptional regulator